MSEKAEQQMSAMTWLVSRCRTLQSRLPWLGHTLLLLVCYVAFLFYQKPVMPTHAGNAASIQTMVDSLRQKSLAMLPAAWQRPAMNQEVTTGVAASASATAGVVARASSPEEPAPIATLAPDYSSPTRHLESLQQAVRSDDNPANRLAGIAEIKQFVASGNHERDRDIIDTLSLAAQDGDPEVARAGQRALQEAQAAIKAAMTVH